MSRASIASPLLIVTAALSVACSRPPSEPPVKPPPTTTTQANPLPAPSSPGLLVAVLGDWGNGTAGQGEVAMSIRRRAAKTPYDFLITVGDNIYPTGIESPDDPRLKIYFDDVYKGPGLDVDIYPALGNHDHYGDPDAQVAYSAVNPRWKMPARYHRYEKRLPSGSIAEFIVVDTQTLQSGADTAQEKWLDEILAMPKGRWRIVYGHHPIRSRGPHGDNVGLAGALDPRMRKAGVDLFLTGHDHNMQVFEDVLGVSYAVCGGAGGREVAYPLTSNEGLKFGATGGGFCELYLGDDELVVTLIGRDGRDLYRYHRRTPAVGPSKGDDDSVVLEGDAKDAPLLDAQRVEGQP